MLQCGEDGLDGEGSKAARGPEEFDFFAAGAPDFFGGRTPEDEAGKVQRGGEVRNSGVMADEGRAGFHFSDEFNQRQVLRDLDAPRWQWFGQALAAGTFGFAADEEEVPLCFPGQSAEKFLPLGFGPVFLLASAAGMHREAIPLDAPRRFGRRQCKSRARVRIANAEGFERAQ
jgi:hypothetical protein